MTGARRLGSGHAAVCSLFAGSDALEQIWAFIVFPLIGGALGTAAFRLVHPGE